MNIFASNIFNLSNILSFLIGLLSGVLLLFGIFLIIISRGKKEKRKTYSPIYDALNQDKINEMILNKQNDLIYQIEENDKDYINTSLVLAKELIHEISSYYYPNSKRPEYELTILEAADLTKYVVDHIVQLFDKPILNRFKNISLANIAELLDKSRKVKHSNVYKTMSNEGSEVFDTYKTTINILNPVYWFKRIVINGTISIAMKKFCKAGLSITGSEANKVYSKNLFKNDESKLTESINEIFNDEREDE